MKKHLSSLIRVSAGGMNWWLPEEQRECLLGPDGLRLHEWLQSGQARIVKRGHQRIVYRVELPDLIFYLKHNLMPDMRSWLRQLIRPSKARVEFDRALAVAKRGLPTITPLALGEKCSLLGSGESFIITHSLEGTQSLHSFLMSNHDLSARQKARIRQTLAQKLGRVMGQIHEAGILHADLHSGNILLRDCHAESFSLFLIDFNAVRLGAPLGWSKSLENLAMLNRWFICRSTRTDRLRFWKAYELRRAEGKGEERQGDKETRRQGDSQASGSLSPCLLVSLSPSSPDPALSKMLARQVEERTIASVQVLCGHFERRCLKTNRYFRVVRGSAAAGHVVTDLDPAEWAPLLEDPDEPFRRPGAKLFKDSPTSSVMEFDVQLGGKTRRVIYKRFFATSWTDPLASLFRSSPARRSWIAGQALLHRSLPTPRPLLMMHRRRFGLDWEGYLMTEKIEYAQSLTEFLDALPRDEESRAGSCRRFDSASLALLRQRIDQVAQVMRELHRWNFANRDPKAANWLLGPVVETDHLQPNFGGVWIIDLVGISRNQKVTVNQRVKNLARLNASFHGNLALSRSDRVRFLRTYLRWNLAGKEGWKTWWRQIEQATLAKVALNARRNRALT